MRTREQEALDSLKHRAAICWDMAEVFLQTRTLMESMTWV
jgi:hypothetical protein